MSAHGAGRPLLRPPLPPAAGTPAGRAQPPAAVEAPGRSTQRVNKGTQKVQKTTGRIEHGTKKITARSAAAMGYQTSRNTPAMPSTKKGKLDRHRRRPLHRALGGVMYMIKAGQVDPEKVKHTMAEQMKDINKKYKPDQIVEIDEAIHAVSTSTSR